MLEPFGVAGPEVARMITEFEDDTTRSHQKSLHHQYEQHPGSQATFVNDVTSLSAVIEEMGSPFQRKAKISWF